MRKITCEPTMEVSGATMLSIVENMRADEIAPLVEKYGFEDIAPSEWYPLQDFLDFLHEMGHDPNLAANLVSVGMSIAETALMPSELEHPTFEQMVEGWDDHYQSNFRNGDAGYKQTTKVDKQHYKVAHNNTIMPDNLEYGVLYGFAKRFLPPGTRFTVWFDEDMPRMDKGGEQTILHVEWS